ncbi:kinase-like domain-containing protein, partial [Fomes fomentarius]
VLVKVIKRGSPEYSINQHLLKATLSKVPYAFPYVISPVAMLDSHHEFSFMILPLWGQGYNPERFTTTRQILRYIECLLNGLVYLHEHRIVHRDIGDHNAVTNAYCLEDEYHFQGIVAEHSRSTAAVFAFIDFDLAIELPRDVSHRECRLPSSKAWCGMPCFHPPDYLLAEPEYNPFAFDVGCLGMMFLYYFTNAVPMIPPLAALCAKMTTWKVEERFTAAEALSFFVDHVSPFLDERAVALDPSLDPLLDPDLYWSLLSPADRRSPGGVSSCLRWLR